MLRRMIHRFLVWWDRSALEACSLDLRKLRREVELEEGHLLRWDALFNHPTHGEEAVEIADRASSCVRALRERGEEAIVPWHKVEGDHYVVCYREWHEKERRLEADWPEVLSDAKNVAYMRNGYQPLEWQTAEKGKLWLADTKDGRYSIWKGEPL